MLKREIEQKMNYTNEQIKLDANDSCTLKENFSILDEIKRHYMVLRIINTILMLVTLILQIFLGNGILHLFFCQVIGILSILLALIPENRIHYIFIASVWELNFISSLFRLLV